MARNTHLTCDVCRKATTQIVAKLFYTPTEGEKPGIHSNYTFHADVGVCCKDRIVELLNFRPRMTASEYRAKRKGGRT